MIYWTKVHWNGLTRIMDHNGIQARCRSIEPIYILSPLGCDRRQQWRLCLEPRNAHECNEFNEFESSLRCAPDCEIHIDWGQMLHHRHLGEERRQGVICGDSRCDAAPHILIYSCPGSCTAGWSSRPCQEPICLHLLKTSQRLKLLANYGRLFIFWWQSLESLWERVPLLSVDWGLRLALAKLQQLLPTRQERFN